jgi:hypothetical protein
MPRRRVTELSAKVRFLATDTRMQHRLSMVGLSEACGKPKGWLKSATATDREIKTLEPEVERQLAELCGFDPDWPEWTWGTAAAFRLRLLRALAGSAMPQAESVGAVLVH